MRTQAGKALGWGMWIGNTIIGLILLALVVAGAWRWYDSHVRAQSKNQIIETAARDVRETAECRLEAFKLRPGLTETDLEVQAAFMDICMEARGHWPRPQRALNPLHPSEQTWFARLKDLTSQADMREPRLLDHLVGRALIP